MHRILINAIRIDYSLLDTSRHAGICICCSTVATVSPLFRFDKLVQLLNLRFTAARKWHGMQLGETREWPSTAFWEGLRLTACFTEPGPKRATRSS